MIQKDFFGLDKEQKLKASKVRYVFTPHQPIQDVSFFCGRESEVSRVLEYLNTPGQHSLLYGDRGVGKSSLANIVCDLLITRLVKGQVFKKRCDSYDNFSTIFREPLLSIGVDINQLSIEKVKSKSAGVNNIISPIILNANKNATTKSEGDKTSSLSPSWVCEKIKSIEGILLIDEFDTISSAEEKKKIAELIKHLSDSNSKFKLLLVGIAKTSSELTQGHPSVQRCLKETRITRMSEDELASIIITGAKKLKLNFLQSAMIRVVKVSSGYPHFTHLLCLKAAEDAILEDRKDITVWDVVQATRRAVDDCEGTLKEAYENAIRSSSTDQYKRILLAAACCNEEEFKAADLRIKYEKIYNVKITQGQLNNHFIKIVSEKDSKILKRIAKGVYRFNDPRMPSFIKISQSFIEKD